MKATMTPEPTVYTLEIGGVKFPNMRVKSHWNGLTEMLNDRGERLIVIGESGFAHQFATLINQVFRTVEQTASEGVMVVAGSEALLARIAAAGSGVSPS